MSWETQTILRLCLVTGQRVSEVAGLEARELLLDEKEWRLPGCRVKNGNAHIVPLSDLALELIEEARSRAGDSPFLFSSAQTSKAITGHAVAKAMKRSLEPLGLKNATPHDLRRTAATGMAELRFPRTVIDKILNHVSADRGTIIGTYDRYAYGEEKRRALDAWAERLRSIVEERAPVGNVVDLRAR